VYLFGEDSRPALHPQAVHYLYLNPDASPQGGLELMAGCFMRAQTGLDDEGNLQWYMTRSSMPLQALRPEMYGAAGKTLSVLFAVLLETGFKVGSRCAL
jgi:hypothetical protein